MYVVDVTTGKWSQYDVNDALAYRFDPVSYKRDNIERDMGALTGFLAIASAVKEMVIDHAAPQLSGWQTMGGIALGIVAGAIMETNFSRITQACRNEINEADIAPIRLYSQFQE
jgi:hypothetical protein